MDTYHWAHFVHLGLLAAWIAVAATADAAISRAGREENAETRVSEFKRGRRLTLMLEMPFATVILIAGLVMVFNDPSVFKQVWFHVKLSFVIILLFLFVLASLRQRSIGDVIDGELSEVKRRVASYTWLRFGSGVAILGLILAVTFRFGAPVVAP